MNRAKTNKLFYFSLLCIAIWLCLTYLLPLVLPFILGLLLALTAEPLVQLANRRLRLSRGISAGLGVLVALVFLTGLALFIGSVTVRQVTVLTSRLPDMQNTAQQGLEHLHRLLGSLAENAPANLQGLLQQTVDESFTDSTALMKQVSEQIPGAVTGILRFIPKGTLTVFTGILSAFMISARLPRLKTKLAAWMPESWQETWLPALQKLRASILQWLKAQGKLALITWAVVGTGLTLLRIPYGLLWGAVIALMDAMPILGTGLVLIPWAVVHFLQGNTALGLGLLGTYGVAFLLRSTLEPRLVGKHLGLDPLLTLVCFYVCYKLFGFTGMLLSPFLAVTFSSILKK